MQKVKEKYPDINVLGAHTGYFSPENDNIFKIGIGCGGSIDVLAGAVKRAPKSFIKLHLEWFYRLLKQPTRFKRMLVLPQFVKEVKKSKKEMDAIK